MHIKQYNKIPLVTAVILFALIPLTCYGQTEKDSGVEAQGAQTPKRTLDLSGPRATMRVFLLAVQDATGDHPERIDDAVACLDASKLDGQDDEKDKLARTYASRLHALIEGVGVKLDDIPEQSDEPVFTFYEHVDDDPQQPSLTIQLARLADSGRWLFTAETLAAIPALEKTASRHKKATDSPDTKTTIPAARISPRATMETFLAAMNADPPRMVDAVQCLDPTGRDPKVWEVRGEELATKLKNVMDKIEEVVLPEIKVGEGETEYIWHTSPMGNIVIGRIDQEPAGETASPYAPQKGEWRFTAQTLKTLNALYDEFEDTEIVQSLQDAGVEEKLTFAMRLRRTMPPWARKSLFGLEAWRWLALIALVPLGWLVLTIASAFVGVILRRWLRFRRIEIDHGALRRVYRSSGAVVTVLVWYCALGNLGLPDSWLAVLLPAAKLALAVTGVLVAYRAVDILGGHIAANKDVQLTRFDDVLIPLLRGILRVLVVVVGFLIISDWWGLDLGAVLGALGIGGLALAFAAQDTISNFFGSITVLFDRPFGIGDWIVLGDVEGTVERVGFRSTRVRTFYNSVFTIPNSKMVNTQVDNFGARKYRRIRVMLAVTYDTTPEKMDAFCEGIRELIRLHPYTRKDYYHVYFNQLAASSLDILLYCFLETPDWSTELRERHRLFNDILRLAKRLGVEFAYPTQTLWMRQTPPDAERSPVSTLSNDTSDFESFGAKEAGRVFAEAGSSSVGKTAPVRIETTPRSARSSGEAGDS